MGDDAINDLRKEIALRALPPRGITRKGLAAPGAATRDFTPLPWSDFFEDKHHLKVGPNTFCLYKLGFKGNEDTAHPMMILLHGGGYSGLSWSVVAKRLSEEVNVRILAIDQRGHGETVIMDEFGENDLSIQRLSQDVKEIYCELSDQMGHTPPVILLGHSMGGAVAVHTSMMRDHLPVQSLVVIDVVEGTALEALNDMQCFLRSRPKSFPSLENAIQWAIRTGQTTNIESARVSMPSQLKPTGDGTGFDWRIDLAPTEQFWKGWFSGLSQHFLSSPPPFKFLLLAGVDRLDKALTIGQMQGKFRMVVLPGGHTVHEDHPDKVSEVVSEFVVRSKIASTKQ